MMLIKPKFIPIFNYLLETSQIYAILKSLWKLNYEGIVQSLNIFKYHLSQFCLL